MSTNHEELSKWKEATQDIADLFVGIYFGEEYNDEAEWVADQIGGILVVHDYFFGLQFMVDALELRVTKEMMFDYYYYTMEGENHVNFRTFVRLGGVN